MSFILSVLSLYIRRRLLRVSYLFIVTFLPVRSPSSASTSPFVHSSPYYPKWFSQICVLHIYLFFNILFVRPSFSLLEPFIQIPDHVCLYSKWRTLLFIVKNALFSDPVLRFQTTLLFVLWLQFLILLFASFYLSPQLDCTIRTHCSSSWSYWVGRLFDVLNGLWTTFPSCWEVSAFQIVRVILSRRTPVSWNS